MSSDTDKIWQFSAYNTESIYGYGSRIDADEYLQWLNRDREIDLYEMCEFEMDEEKADRVAFELRETLEAIEDGEI